jgi:hypothetical protein
MSPSDALAHRLALVEAEQAYLDAQRRLVGLIELAVAGRGEWPSGRDYAETAELGRAAAQVRRQYLDLLGVPRHSYARPGERMELIHRLSASERKWQPHPDAWLTKQDRRD